MIKTNDDTDQMVSLRSFVAILFKRKLAILFFSISIVLIVTAASFIMEPVYEASSTIMIEREADEEKAMLLKINSRNLDYDWLRSEVEILKSFPVASQVVNDLLLEAHHPQYDTLTIEEQQDLINRKIDRFQKSIGIDNPRESNLIRISYQDNNPSIVAPVVEKTIEAYMQYRSEIYSNSDMYKFFEEQIRITDDKLKDLERNLTDYKDEEELIAPEAQGQILLARLSEYEKNLTAVQTQLQSKVARLNVIRKQLDSESEISQINIPAQNETSGRGRELFVAQLKGNLLTKELQLQDFLQRFKPTYKGIIDLENQISAIKEEIKDEIRQIIEQEQTTINVLKSQERTLKASISRINQQVRSFAQKEFDLTQLNRGIDHSREIYSMLLKQREEVRISMAKLQRDVRAKVISPAKAPLDPIMPRKGLFIAASMFIGLIVGLSVAVFSEYFDHTINSTEEMRKYTNLRVLGAVKEYKEVD